MTERPYRNGAQRSCLLCRQPEAIQEEIKQMANTQTFNTIVEWLKDRDIDATWNQVRYYIVKSGVRTRRSAVMPRKTYPDKVNAYIDALLEYNAKTFTIYTINLHGSTWSIVTKRLHADGLIKKIRDYTPIRWRVLASKDEINEWRNEELKTR